MSSIAPFAHRIVAMKIPRTGVEVSLSADAAQRMGIADELGLASVERLSATFEAIPAKGGQFRVKGEVRADVHQLCGVTLEPFPVAIVEKVDARFVPEDALGEETAAEVIRTLDEEDPPEPLDNGAIDLARLAVEALALALDPYPRKPGVAFATEDEAEAKVSPFAALAALKTATGGGTGG
ncbi:MAG: YceD family protein [Beijerinckiaceae bacterium]